MKQAADGLPLLVPYGSPGSARSEHRLGILAQGGRNWIAGVVYLQNLIRALHVLPEAERPSIQLLLGPGQDLGALSELGGLLPPSRAYAFRSPQSLRVKMRAAVRMGLHRSPASLERLVRTGRISALFPVRSALGAAFPCPWIGWIPDFQHLRLPGYFTEAERQQRDRSFRRIIEQATCVVVSSQDACRDLLEWFPAAADRIGVLPFVTVATPEWYGVRPEAVVTRMELPRKFLIYPSQFWMHKNHRCLFEAIRIAGERCPDIALVCTGHMHDYRDPTYGSSLLAELARDGLRDRVHCVGLLDRTTQVQLMRAVAAVVQPSLFEGWSSLVEDAQALGKDLYLSDIPIHREQDPPNANYFDPESPESFATLIIKDWEGLRPGPDHDREAAARTLQESRAAVFARRFMGILGEVVAC